MTLHEEIIKLVAMQPDGNHADLDNEYIHAYIEEQADEIIAKVLERGPSKAALNVARKQERAKTIEQCLAAVDELPGLLVHGDFGNKDKSVLLSLVKHAIKGVSDE